MIKLSGGVFPYLVNEGVQTFSHSTNNAKLPWIVRSEVFIIVLLQKYFFCFLESDSPLSILSEPSAFLWVEFDA